MPLFRKYSLSQIIASVFSTLFLATLLLILYPYIPNINAYDAYGEPVADGPNPQDSDAVPPPVVPCLDTQSPDVDMNPEFHSMRPYQASPCGPRPVAYYCNNDYTIIEDVGQRWDSDWCYVSQGAYICPMRPNTLIDQNGLANPVYIIGGANGRDYYITLSRAQYPVVGDTQDVFNSQSTSFDEKVGLGTRMNDYVSWYLQGDLEKAEYGAVYPDDALRYAGPTKLLVPFDYLNHRRLEIAHDAGVKPKQGVNLEEYQGPDDLLDVDPQTGEATTEQTLAHNQIVVCSTGGVIHPCYRGNNTPASNLQRLLRWWEAKGSLPWETYYNSQGNRFANWDDSSVWGGITPPFPWLFDNDLYYRKAYREWRGAICAIISGRLICVNTGDLAGPACGLIASDICSAADLPGPLCLLATPVIAEACEAMTDLVGEEMISRTIDTCNGVADTLHNTFPETFDETDRDLFIYSCTNNIIAGLNVFPSGSAGRNIFADLYRYIPLGNPSDKNAGHVVGGIGARAPGRTIVRILDYEIARIPVLHYPHTQSTVEVAKLLNQTHTPLDCDEETGKCEKIKGLGTNFEPRSCTFTPVNTYPPADSLTFNDRPTYLHVDNIRTEVAEIECQNQGEIRRFMEECGGVEWPICATEACDPSPCGLVFCPNRPAFCASTPRCEAEISIEIRSTPKIPFVDQLWKETVVGVNSSFRKIFPKIEEGAPVSCIAQIPAKTSVMYISGQETNLKRIDTAGPNSYAGNGPSSQSQGELFFPHLGTVYEYFLKGIQTALRPLGYWSTSLDNGDPEICALGGGIGECRMWLFMKDPDGQYYYEKIIEAAQSTSCNGRTLNPAWALFIALNEDAGLMTDHIQGWGDAHFGCRISHSLDPQDTIESKLACMINTLRTSCSAGLTDEEILCRYGYEMTDCGFPNDYDFGYLQQLLGGQVVDDGTLPPIFGSGNIGTGSYISNLLSIDWASAFDTPRLVNTFCPNSPELVHPPYQ